MRCLFIFLWLYSAGLVAQISSKINTDLFVMLNEHSTPNQEKIFIPALIKGDLKTIQQIVAHYNGYYKYGVKDIASVHIPLIAVKALQNHSLIQRIEYREAKAQHLSFPQDSLMLTNNNAWNVHTGQGSLPYSFLGDGVLLGIIDDGFEWLHPDFMTMNNKTRILYLWDQIHHQVGFLEQDYGYGSSWDALAINNGVCTHTPGEHGSHVMGTAGGNANASGKYRGIAPNADLACVNVVRDSNFLASFVDGVHYLFQKADQLGQPCAINSSVGSYSSGHDGKDLYSQLIDNMLDQQAGRVLVQAAGNARGFNFHLGVEQNNNTSKTWFAYHGDKNKTHFDLYADTADFNNLNFSFQLINPQTQQVEAQSATYNILQDFSFTGSVAYSSQVLFFDNAGAPVTLELFIDQYEDAYELAVNIHSQTDLGYWQLTTTGQGKYDIWSSDILMGSSDIIIPTTTVSNYSYPDNEQSIVGYWTCSDKVISVACYQNRDQMVAWSSDTINIGTAGYPLYGIASFSSLGPTRTGIQKPDLTAPGGQVLSAAPIGTLNSYKFSNNTRLDIDGWHISNRGTSMAAPMVAGAAALYLQCKPYANYSMVKQALESSARLDPFVFNQIAMLPNIHWGYGKLDVYNLLESCLIYGCTDSTALNYNPLATVNDSSACFYLTTTIHTIQKDLSLQCSPNPANQNTIINYSLLLNNSLPAQLDVYNHLGQVIWSTVLHNSTGSIEFNTQTLATGTYWIVLEQDGKKHTHQQLFISH